MKTAFVLIDCDLGKERDVISKLKQIEHVTEAHGIFGAYDILAEVKAEHPEALRQTITWRIRKIPAIRSTLTLMTVDGQE